jgi:hypothetical protein
LQRFGEVPVRLRPWPAAGEKQWNFVTLASRSFTLECRIVVNRAPGAFVMGRRGHSVWLPLEATKELMS